jgi:chaperone required for assembly of F1-ATPase
VKRFWDEASVQASDDGYTILLDGRPVHLPGGAILTVPARALAQAIAAEWQTAGGAKGGEMTFADTPLSRLAGTAQERIAPDPVPTVEAIARYGETDLLCYRAERPEALVARQAREWQPWLHWAALAYDVPLRVTSGVGHVTQSEAALSALRYAVASLGPWRLAGLGIAVPALGSVVLGLALAEGRLDPARAHEIASLDELFQAEQWGDDPEAVSRRQRVGEDVALAGRFMQLCAS